MYECIDIIDPDIENLFITDRVLFKIISIPASSKNGEDIFSREVADHTLDISLEEYKIKYKSHEYIAILAILHLPLKIAYLYGCLNMKRGVKRDKEFSVWYRQVGQHNWNVWFNIRPYIDE